MRVPGSLWRFGFIAMIMLGASGLFGLRPIAAHEYGDRLFDSFQGDADAVPPPMESATGPSGEAVLNVMLLGSDTTNPVNAGRTDVIMVVSVNQTRHSVNLLSIPRDLYIYVPDTGSRQRINTVYGLGENNGYEDGGYGLLKQVIQYNLGLQIDHYARVDFNDFQGLVEALGGIELTVPCALQDWQLISPELDPALEENWQLVTLPVGVQQLNGYEALWYVRSRRTSSDFDRGRRQQDVVRAIWRKANALGLINQAPALWGDLRESVHTDMAIHDLLALVPTALAMDAQDIAHFRFKPEVHVRSWLTPNGEAVQVPQREALGELMQQFMQPVTDNRLGPVPPRVEILNATGYAGMDRVAADQLSWEGFAAYAGGDIATGYQSTSTVYDFAPSQKGHQLDRLLEALQIGDRAAVMVVPSAERTAEFRVILGGDYRSCQFNVRAPVPTDTP